MAKFAPFYPAAFVFAGALLVAIGGFWASWRQSNFNIEIRKKNEEIALLQKQSADAITGGDSFAELAFRVLDRSGNMPNAHTMPDALLLVPTIIHRGKNPLYDVAARIVEVPTAKADNSFNSYPIGNMTPGLAVATAYQIPHDGKNLNFNIFFVARNGTWIQFLRMPWVGDGWGRASKIVRDGKVVFREVSENFPRTERGEIDWGEPAAQDHSADK
jgi:hypothetical protein